MSQADELLMSLGEDIIQTASGNIVIGSDRFITVPDSLKKIAVQYDHDIETVTFDCPRYWDGHDLSKMRIYVNYMRPDGVLGSHVCSNVVFEASDNDIMHFDWTISGHVTYVSGTITFLICVKNVDADGNEENIWHTEINSDMYVSTGMKCHETILRRYPDIITQLLYRMDQSEAIVEAAREAEDGANEAKESIENMTVSAEALEMGEGASVEKTVVNDVVNLHFGLPKGDTGNGIKSIVRTSGDGSNGTTDIYTITFTDETTTTFGVYNGKDSDMLSSVYDPQGRAQDIFEYVDTVDIDGGEWDSERVLQVKRGLKENMPTLAQAEFGFTTDSGAEELYIGNGAENIPLARKDQIAPAGYGLGGGAAEILDYDWNNAVDCGYYSGKVNAPEGNTWYFGEVVRVNEDSRALVQTAFRSRSSVVDVAPTLEAKRYGLRNPADGIYQWAPWEWDNPPMLPGVEYRTTERHNGEAKYTKLIDFGELPDTNIKSVTAISERVSIISFSGVAYNDVETNAFPVIFSTGLVAYAYTTLGASDTNIMVRTLQNLSGYSAKFIIKYTKD